MAGSFAFGTVAAHAFMGAVGAIAGGMAGAAKGALDLSSRLEQAKIGFTTMLGSGQAASAFIKDLQDFAEGTAFNFPGIQQVASNFMAMGIEAKNVIPIISDVSSALAAAGHGGDTARLERVGMSLAEIAAQGKVTGEQLRELSRNGIAVLPMLAAAFGTTTAEVRKMAEEGEISAEQFFEAFHSETARRYGDIMAEQAKTWAVASSNVMDILGRLTTETLSEFFGALTQGALLLQDFLKSSRAQQWAASLKASIHDVMTVLAPLAEMMREVMGVSGQSGAAPKPKAPAAASQAMIVSPEAVKSADEYKTKIAEAKVEVHGVGAALDTLKAKQVANANLAEDIKDRYAAVIQGLKDEQEALNTRIEATKTHWEGVIAPLERVQDQLGRLAEDTKADFARIMDPLKTGLEQTNRAIEETKQGYEDIVRPIKAQISAIDKATAALTKQRRVQQDIADLALDQKALNALGDPTQRAEIAGQLKRLELQRDELELQMDRLQLNGESRKNEKAIESVQEKLNANQREEIGIRQQLGSLVDKNATAEIAKQEVLLDASAKQLAIDEKRAQLEGAAAKAPLEERLAAAEAALKSALDPLEAHAAALSRAIEDTAAAEAAALAPIIAAQESVARQIEDANQGMKDALALLEAASKAIDASIKAQEAALRKELEPVLAIGKDLDRQQQVLDARKDAIQANIDKWGDEGKKIDEINDKAAKLAKPLRSSGGGNGPAPMVGDDWKRPIPKSFIAPETIQSFKDLAANVQASADAFNNLNAAMSGAGLPLGNVAEAVGKLAILTVAVGWIRNFGLAIVAAVRGLTLTNPLVAAWSLFVMAQIDTVVKEWNATDWDKMGQDWNNWLAGMSAAADTWNIERTAAWNKFWEGLPAAKETFWANFKADQIEQHRVTSEAWKGFTDGLGKVFGDTWNGLKGLAETGWTMFTDWLKPAVDGVVAWINPIAAAFKGIGDAIRNLPASLPDWWSQRPGWLGGGGLQRTNLSLRGGGAPLVVGNGEIETYIRQAARLRNISEDIAVRVALSEGGLHDPVRQSDVINERGEREQSFGPFQLYMNGGLGNSALAADIDPRIPADWQRAIDFALDRAAEGGWAPWHGAARVGIGDWEGLGGASPAGISGGGMQNYLLTAREVNDVQLQLVDSSTAVQRAQDAATVATARARVGLGQIMAPTQAASDAQLQAATALGTGVPTQLANGMKTAIPVVVGAATMVNGQVISALAPPVEAVAGVGSGVVNGLAVVLRNGVPTVVDASSVVGEQIIQALAPLPEAAGQVGQQVPAQVAAGIRNGTGAVVNSIENLVSKAMAAWNEGDFEGVRNAFNLNPPPLQRFALGGVKHGNGLAYLHDGERVLTPSQQRLSFSSLRGGGGGFTWTGDLIIPGSSDPQATARAVRDELLKIQRNNAGRVL